MNKNNRPMSERVDDPREISRLADVMMAEAEADAESVSLFERWLADEIDGLNIAAIGCEFDHEVAGVIALMASADCTLPETIGAMSYDARLKRQAVR